jgi:hypothetical protein
LTAKGNCNPSTQVPNTGTWATRQETSAAAVPDFAGMRFDVLEFEVACYGSEKIMITCDLCGEAEDCLQKEIEGKEYDICSQCWNQLAQKLKGKGRTINRETVFLPPPRHVEEREDDDPQPGEPPKIWGGVCVHE